MDPNPNDIHIDDIATALAKTCRYGGHCEDFYSVAEHCVLATQQALLQGDRDILLEVLLHDAAEAYIGDVTKPLKVNLPDYLAIESNMEEAIRLRFDLKSSVHERVKAIDYSMLFLEKRELFDCEHESWEDENKFPAAQVEIKKLHWTLARDTFLQVFDNLSKVKFSRRRTKPMKLLES